MGFRIAHCSDWHIGYASGKNLSSNGINLRVVDGYNALHSIISDIIDNNVNVMVMAGDVFHTPYPSPRDIWFVQKQLRRLAKANIRAYMLAGNHDASDIKSDLAASKLLHDDLRGLFSYVEPYTRVEIEDGLFLHLVSHHQYNEQKDTFDNIERVQGGVNLFTTHGSVVDPILDMVLSTPQSPREIVIPDFLLDGWDYCLLGHIHERKLVGKNMLYNGSLLRRGFADKECELGRGWTLIDVDSNGECKIAPKRVFERPQVDLPVIECQGLSVNEINSVLASNIDTLSFTDGGFDCVLAPIVRQRFVNVDFNAMVGIDNSIINNVRGKCFSFDTSFMSVEKTKTLYDDKSSGQGDSQNRVSLIDQYESWSTQDRIVKNMARKHIETGLEKVLLDDE